LRTACTLIKLTNMTESIKSPEVGDDNLRKICDYLHILEGTDMPSYEKAHGMLDGVLYDNAEKYSVMDIHTSIALGSVVESNTEPTLHNVFLSRDRRTNAAQEVVKGMILGEKVPVEDFKDIIKMVVSSVNNIHQGIPNHLNYGLYKVRREILNVLYLNVDASRRSRSVEALKYVSDSLSMEN